MGLVAGAGGYEVTSSRQPVLGFKAERQRLVRGKSPKRGAADRVSFHRCLGGTF